MTEGRGQSSGRKVELPLEQLFRDEHEGVVRLAKAFGEELGEARVLAIAERMSAEDSAARLRKRLEGIPHACLQDFISYHDRVMGDSISSGAQSGENVEVGDGRFVYVMRECMWARTFRELGAADLGYALNCSSDFASARCFNPKLRLTRSKTLMMGDDCCEFVYTWDD
ncbi:MAG: L-2-amino-thiazoline-4-carboxylic acid hydrolase [Methanomassiliicoccales archaeon]|jgi:hypothetical protein|nr:L-2-amino-thiazoline-4-carboxylic acid hydrolase [Methanomassiliicoccales archaeon]